MAAPVWNVTVQVSWPIPPTEVEQAAEGEQVRSAVPSMWKLWNVELSSTSTVYVPAGIE